MFVKDLDISLHPISNSAQRLFDRAADEARRRGLDASTGQYVDLIEAGIIDPTKVVRLALENAVSAAGVLLLTEATITEIPEPKPAMAAAEALS